jgi:uncharacterized Zn finger protein (UPF0148 family)
MVKECVRCGCVLVFESKDGLCSGCRKRAEAFHVLREAEDKDLERIEKIFADTWKTGSTRPQLNRDSAVPYFDIC